MAAPVSFGRWFAGGRSWETRRPVSPGQLNTNGRPRKSNFARPGDGSAPGTLTYIAVQTVTSR
ncbi:MAG TPA: hypothetical protein VNO24_30300 [Blastocatellia bacterium]|nr:hypothetical protein [Blastocatellia bacterium]